MVEPAFELCQIPVQFSVSDRTRDLWGAEPAAVANVSFNVSIAAAYLRTGLRDFDVRTAELIASWRFLARGVASAPAAGVVG